MDKSTTTPPGKSHKETVAAQRLGTEANKVDAELPKPSDLESQVSAVRAENAAVREQLRKMEEQQKALMEMVMWAIDGGMKWRGLAINGQYYFR